LDTLRKPVNIEKLIQKIPPASDGIYPIDIVSLMKSEGVNATNWSGRTDDDLARYTFNGNPIVVRIIDGTKSSNFSHLVVVDGVTSRNGIKVVAIRNPKGAQYFSPVSTFGKHLPARLL
jgi:filamentous hemagglutinin